jgi:ketosteroid isomerase-like protein
MVRFVMLATALAVAPLAAQTPAPPAQIPSITLPPELDRVLRDYERGWQARDAKALAALFVPDGFVMQSGKLPARGTAQIEATYQGAGGPLALRAMAYAVSDTAGYIIGAYAGKVGDPDSGKFILALRRSRGGPWRIAADMDNSNRR